MHKVQRKVFLSELPAPIRAHAYAPESREASDKLLLSPNRVALGGFFFFSISRRFYKKILESFDASPLHSFGFLIGFPSRPSSVVFAPWQYGEVRLFGQEFQGHGGAAGLGFR